MSKFAKGQSGNPGGRPKGMTEVRELAQRLTGRCFEELERIAFMAEQDKDRISAIQIILDRGFGKAAQPVTGAEGGPIMIGWLGVQEPGAPE